jgi:hypothetical protein
MLPEGVIVPIALALDAIPTAWIAGRQATDKFRHHRPPACCGRALGARGGYSGRCRKAICNETAEPWLRCATLNAITL